MKYRRAGGPVRPPACTDGPCSSWVLVFHFCLSTGLATGSALRRIVRIRSSPPRIGCARFGFDLFHRGQTDLERRRQGGRQGIARDPDGLAPVPQHLFGDDVVPVLAQDRSDGRVVFRHLHVNTLKKTDSWNGCNSLLHPRVQGVVGQFRRGRQPLSSGDSAATFCRWNSWYTTSSMISAKAF